MNKPTCTEATLREVIAQHGGHLIAGCGTEENGQVCVLQARALCLGLPLTDDPRKTNMPDIRRLNDARWSSNAVRTEQMIRLAVAFAEWGTWTRERKIEVVTKIAILTVNRIIAELPRLSDELRSRCRAAQTRGEAQNAAREVRASCAAAYAASASASSASSASASSASSASCAAAYASCAADADAYAYADASADAYAYAASSASASSAYAAAAYASAAAADRVLTAAVDLWVEASAIGPDATEQKP